MDWGRYVTVRRENFVDGVQISKWKCARHVMPRKDDTHLHRNRYNTDWFHNMIYKVDWCNIGTIL